MKKRPQVFVSETALRDRFQRHFRADTGTTPPKPKDAGARRSLHKSGDITDSDEDDEDKGSEESDEAHDESGGSDPDYDPPGGAGGLGGNQPRGGTGTSRGGSGTRPKRRRSNRSGTRKKRSGSGNKDMTEGKGTQSTDEDDDYVFDVPITYCRGMPGFDLSEDAYNDSDSDAVQPWDSVLQVGSNNNGEDPASIDLEHTTEDPDPNDAKMYLLSGVDPSPVVPRPQAVVDDHAAPQEEIIDISSDEDAIPDAKEEVIVISDTDPDDDATHDSRRHVGDPGHGGRLGSRAIHRSSGPGDIAPVTPPAAVKTYQSTPGGGDTPQAS